MPFSCYEIHFFYSVRCLCSSGRSGLLFDGASKCYFPFAIHNKTPTSVRHCVYLYLFEFALHERIRLQRSGFGVPTAVSDVAHTCVVEQKRQRTQDDEVFFSCYLFFTFSEFFILSLPSFHLTSIRPFGGNSEMKSEPPMGKFAFQTSANKLARPSGNGAR